MFKLMRHLDKKIEAIWVYLDRVNVGGPRFGPLRQHDDLLQLSVDVLRDAGVGPEDCMMNHR